MHVGGRQSGLNAKRVRASGISAPGGVRVVLALPQGGIGGVQTHVGDLATGLRAQGVEVTVACGTFGPLVQRLGHAGVPCRVVPMTRRTDLVAIRTLTGLLRGVEADLVHTHSPLAGILGRHAALRARIPMVHTLHGLGVLDELAQAAGMWHRIKLQTYRWHERWLNARTDALIAVSPSVATAAIRARHVVAARVTVIPHGVPVRLRSSNGQSLLVAYVGRLHPEKGVDVLLTSFARVVDRLPAARLRIVGDGPMGSQLAKLITGAQLDARVEILDPTGDIDAAFRGVGCVVLPSRAEGLSYVLLEAMARGIPCVATAVGGTQDLIEHGRTGFLVPSGDADGLAEAVLMVLRDPAWARVIGEAAQREVAERYSPEQMIARTIEVYRAVLAGERR